MKKITILLFLCFAKLSIAQSETVALYKDKPQIVVHKEEEIVLK
jgi:hypothetical protein